MTTEQKKALATLLRLAIRNNQPFPGSGEPGERDDNHLWDALHQLEDEVGKQKPELWVLKEPGK